MTLTGAATALATASALLGTPVNADMGAALALCLDTKLDIPARAAAFKTQAWSQDYDQAHLREIFAASATLGSLDALDPSSWTATRAHAETISQELVGRSAIGDAVVLKSLDARAAVVLQRNSIGLQTCLYVGNDPGLGPVAQTLDGSILRRIGNVTRIRGDGPKSLISAHYLSDAGRTQFTPPLRFGVAFSVVLDRQPGDLQ
ncbi:MAG: hypothetical protein N2B03_09270 [Boseongicola sp.]